MKKYYFVYITTNLLNGKQYVGDHSANKLIDNYFGSGLYIGRALLENGKENFTREILEFFNNKEEAFNAQEKYIMQYNTMVPNGYNISPKGGMQTPDGCADETRKKISNTKLSQNLMMSDEQKKKISKKLAGRKKPPRSKEHSDNISKSKKEKKAAPWNKGLKKDTDERVKKYSESSGKSRKGKPSNMSGKKHRPESIEKLKATLLNKKLNKNK